MQASASSDGRDLLRRSWQAWIRHDFDSIKPWWLQYLWTLGFCVVVAVGFTICGFVAYAGEKQSWGHMGDWWHTFMLNLRVSICVGYSIDVLFAGTQHVIGAERFRRFTPRQRAWFFSVVPLVGIAIGWPLGLLWALGLDTHRWATLMSPNLIAGSVLVAAFVTLVFHALFKTKMRQMEAEKRASEAQLKLLQAQIEPHFLYNTLANVAGLIDADPPRARRMLESFVDYLRSSLGDLRGTGSTLGAEVELVDAYLRIASMRMSDRLRVSIDVPRELRVLPLPPLYLQPLVENAIVHGLEPKIEGGSVAIAAREEGGRLVLTVEDDGLGLATTHGRSVAGPRGAGSALANIRARLAQAYGAAASLRVEARSGGGVRATLTLPLTSDAMRLAAQPR